MQHNPVESNETGMANSSTENTRMRAEIDALTRRLTAFEVGAPASAPNRPRARKARSRPLKQALMLVTVIAVLTALASASVVYGQDVVDALFVSSDGNVGIGTSNPAQKLTVVGSQVANKDADSSLTYAGQVAIKGPSPQLDFIDTNDNDWSIFANDKKLWFARQPREEALVLDGDGNVGIGTTAPNTKLDVNGALTAGGAANGNHFLLSGNKIQQYYGTAPADMYLNWRGGDVIVRGGLNATNMDASGSITAASINGEAPPMIFDVGVQGETRYWYSQTRDIGPLCGDADGCTMKLLFRVSSRDEVRVITEHIYIEQPDKSSNKNPGLHGYTFQAGGGTFPFVLNTATKNDLFVAWDWLYVRNYEQIVNGALVTGDVYSGYQVSFMTRPDVSATVIIYDR